MDRFVTKTSSCKTISSATPTACSNAGDISDSANVSSSVSAGSDTLVTLTSRSSQNPWPYLQEFFEFVSSSKDGDHMVFKCLKCLPMSKCYKAQKKIPLQSAFTYFKHTYILSLGPWMYCKERIKRTWEFCCQQ